MARIDATPADAAARIMAAAPGDTVVLGAGDYPVLGLTDLAAPVTLLADLGAVLGGLRLTRVTGLALKGVRLVAAAKYAIEARDCSDLAVEDCDISGPLVLSPNADGTVTDGGPTLQALLLKGCARVTIRGNRIHDVRVGIGWAQVEGLVIEGNDLTGCAGDAIRGGGRNITIRKNRIGNLYKLGEDHVDAIQFSTAWGFDGVSEDVLIEGNEYRRGRGWAAQGVFMRGLAAPVPSYRNVRIVGNALAGLNHAGIMVSFAENVTIDGNWLRADATSNPGHIALKDGFGGRVTNNSTSGDIQVARNTPAVIAEGNEPQAARLALGDYAAMTAWLGAARIAALERENASLRGRIDAARAALT